MMSFEEGNEKFLWKNHRSPQASFSRVVSFKGEPSQLPYGVQPAGLGVEGKPGPFGGPQVGYESQPAQAIGLDGNGNGLGYLNSRNLQANGLGAGAYGPLAAGQAPGGYGGLLGPGQPLGGYRGKESKYGMNGYLGNGYRVRCPSGKC
ncbi:spidroin-1-like isoform X3 [Python bivittatus]|uniref:Spidroin-1-like isoform X3 n=1 Tax=Python bivittatus TaxID=176946 RepID=A0A9F5IQN5_PYTBI|nr:spidroin-1-like isoform X3 [Python bivittatus]